MSFKLRLVKVTEVDYALNGIKTNNLVVLKHMSKANSITKAPPFEVETAIRQLGANLRTARLARNLSIADVAAKLGVSPRAVRNAETGKPGTAIGVYLGLMWVYGLISQAEDLADPARDEAVMRAARARAHAYPTRKGALDNDF